MPSVFDVRPHTGPSSLADLLAASVPDDLSDPADIVRGPKRTVDTRKLEVALGAVDFAEVRTRRRNYCRLWHEARLAGTPGRGVRFTALLMLIAHYRLIDDNEALEWVDVALTS